MLELNIDEKMFQSPDLLKKILDTITEFILQAAEADIDITPPSEISIPAPLQESSIFTKVNLVAGNNTALVYTPVANTIQLRDNVILEGVYTALLLVADINNPGVLKVDGQPQTISNETTNIFAKQRIEYNGEGVILAAQFSNTNEDNATYDIENHIVYNIKYVSESEKFILALGYNSHPIILNSDARIFKGGYYAQAGETVYFIFTPKDVFLMYANV